MAGEEGLIVQAGQIVMYGAFQTENGILEFPALVTRVIPEGVFLFVFYERGHKPVVPQSLDGSPRMGHWRWRTG